MKTRSWLTLLLLILVSGELTAAERGVVLVPQAGGGEVALYRGSHALLIGVSDYTNGWPDLESVPSELNRVENALRTQGFTIEKSLNPNSHKLERAFEEFIRKYGFDTGTELGYYIQSTVPKYVSQTPQFGKHPDYELARGDFVFALESTPVPLPAPTTKPEGEEAALNLTQSQRRQLQQALNERGFAAGRADGVLGTRTRQALVAYQRSEGLEPNGYLTAAQWTRLLQQTQTTTNRNNELEPEMVAIRGGCFQMGSPKDETDRDDDERRHRVCVEDFELGQYEVTQAQWQAVMGENPSRLKGCDDCAVERVSWNQVQDYLERLNTRTGRRYRLPTEAQWEYACRGGRSGEPYCGGNDLAAVAWYWGNSDRKTHPVGTRQANAFGLFDMSGNVWEWTCSAYDENYSGGEKRCTGKKDGDRRVIRGGSWNYSPGDVRSASRFWSLPGNRFSYVGFRLAQGETD